MNTAPELIKKYGEVVRVGKSHIDTHERID